MIFIEIRRFRGKINYLNFNKIFYVQKKKRKFQKNALEK